MCPDFFRPDIFFCCIYLFCFIILSIAGTLLGACFCRFSSNRELGRAGLKWGVGIISIRPVGLNLFYLFVG